MRQDEKLSRMTSTLNHNKIQQVVDNDMCIACGACIEACDKNKIIPAYNEYRGCNEVQILDTTACLNCDTGCESVCPSIEVDFQKLIPEHSNLSRDGNYISVHIGYSPKNQFNGVSSSGGTLREITHFFLDKGIPVLCLSAESELADGKYNARMIYTMDEMERIPGSIYHSISFSDAIVQIRKVEKCALVAIPCHLEGILNYIHLKEPSLLKKIVFKAGIICGWMYSDHSYLAFSKFHGIDEKITSIGYRGEDRIGKLKFYTNRNLLYFSRSVFNTLHELISYKASYSTDVNRLRCRSCQDHLNFLSDVSVGDAWLKRKRGEKLSIIIARNAVGVELLENLAKKNRLVIEDGTFEDVIESQSSNLVFGTIARKLNTYLSKNRKIYPKFIFEDKVLQDEITVLDHLKFKIEFIKRDLVRAQKYRKYKFIYALTKLKQLSIIYLKIKIKKVINIMKGSDI